MRLIAVDNSKIAEQTYCCKPDVAWVVAAT